MHVVQMRRDAIFLDCGAWRYNLMREFENQSLISKREGTVVMILLNPAKASAEQNDPTNRRGIDFAKRWGFRRLEFVNLFAGRTPYPGKLKEMDDPVGPENDRHILEACGRADKIVCGWGNHGEYMNRSEEVYDMISEFRLECFGVNQSGEPVHPLYQPSDAETTEYSRGQ
nr:MAG: uncharacterized protein conserved in bacteria [Candidatus Nanosalinarum sp. J07AB56]